jgi:hypothetical protein
MQFLPEEPFSPAHAALVFGPPIGVLSSRHRRWLLYMGWHRSANPNQPDAIYSHRPTTADQRSYGFLLKARYRNPTGSLIYFQTCRDPSSSPIFSVVAVSSDTTRSGYNPFRACPATPPIPLAPGETRVDTVRVSGPVVRDGETNEPLGVLEGTFRLVYDASATRNLHGETLPDRQSRSNPVRVQIEK